MEILDGAEHVVLHPSLKFIQPVAEQKLALLKAAPVGTKIESIGWRRTEDIFYLRFFKDDIPLGEHHE